MGIDEDAIAFRNWKPQVEARLAALETRPAGGSAPTAPTNIQEVEALKAQVTDLISQVEALKAQVEATSGVLAGVEAALGAHSHPPSPPAEPVPADAPAAPEA